jgi:hypothetical protein
VFGCGSLTGSETDPACAPLNRFSHDMCGSLQRPPWRCDDIAGDEELLTVVKLDPSGGGVLCCN